jgi:hypothetical protein
MERNRPTAASSGLKASQHTTNQNASAGSKTRPDSAASTKHRTAQIASGRWNVSTKLSPTGYVMQRPSPVEQLKASSARLAAKARRSSGSYIDAPVSAESSRDVLTSADQTPQKDSRSQVSGATVQPAQSAKQRTVVSAFCSSYNPDFQSLDVLADAISSLNLPWSQDPGDSYVWSHQRASHTR